MQLRIPTLLTISAVALFSLAISGCSKSNGSGSSGNGISASISGSGFSPTATAATYSATYQNWDILGYSIRSGDSTGLEAIFFEPFALNKAFTTDTTNLTLIYYTNGINGKQYGVGAYWFGAGYGSASMTVTSLDTTAHKVAGTFTGTLYASSTDSVKVTNGQFNTTYVVGP